VLYGDRCSSAKGAKETITIKLETKDDADGKTSVVQGTLTREYRPPASEGRVVKATAKFKRDVTFVGEIPILATEGDEQGLSYALVLVNPVGAMRGILISQDDASLKDADLSCGLQ
jgi:hypothetical protein